MTIDAASALRGAKRAMASKGAYSIVIVLMMSLTAVPYHAEATHVPRSNTGMPAVTESYYKEIVNDLIPFLDNGSQLLDRMNEVFANATYNSTLIPNGSHFNESQLALLFSAARQNVNVTKSVQSIFTDPGNFSRKLDAANSILKSSRNFTYNLSSAVNHAIFDLNHLRLRQERNVDYAQSFVHTLHDPLNSRQAVSIALNATRLQAEVLGYGWESPSEWPARSSPSAAIRTLLDIYGITPVGDLLTKILAYDLLPDPVRSSLTKFVDAYVAFDNLTRHAYTNPSLLKMRDRSFTIAGSANSTVDYILTSGSTPPWARLFSESGINLSKVLPMRNELLQEAERLAGDLRALDPADIPLVLRTCDPVQASLDLTLNGTSIPLPDIPTWPNPDPNNPQYTNGSRPPGFIAPSPSSEHSSSIVTPSINVTLGVLSIEILGCDTTYNKDMRLLIDNGGNDTYLNNAGGSGGREGEGGGCIVLQVGLGGAHGPSPGPAALIDVDGNDQYTSRRACGINGGGYGAIGFLYDAGGNDTYTGKSNAINGGAALGGLGFLLDAGGNEVYNTSDPREGGGVNGGAYVGGMGFLLDGSGDDHYTAGSAAVNAGSQLAIGMLIDLGGNDKYTAKDSASNGGSIAGYALLFDGAGNDEYNATSYAVNGGGISGSVSVLSDIAGNDTYLSGRDGGVNGGALASVSMLIDGNGNDTYSGGAWGVNGGAGGFFGPTGRLLPGIGILIDGAGKNTFEAGAVAVNGGGVLGGMGHLVSGTDADTYTATHFGTNGGGAYFGTGFLLDPGGADEYSAGANGTNGGAWGYLENDFAPYVFPAAGYLLDLDGSDRYTALHNGTNGGAVVGVGVLVDRRGNDVYNATAGGANGGGAYGHGNDSYAWKRYVDSSIGLLIDSGGNDTLLATTGGVNGGGNDATGLLLNGGGTDRYEDGEGGTGQDKTVVPKGNYGAQLDVLS